MTLPTFKMAGSDPRELARAYKQAAAGLRDAIDLMAATRPHARDYMDTADGHAKALGEHASRLSAMTAMMRECEEAQAHCLRSARR